MQTIAINTTQNVTIEYELASVRDRIIAFIFDLIIIVMSCSVMTIFYTLAFNRENQIYFTYFVLIPWFFFYTLIQEIFGNGQSWGKKILGIKVVKINGKESGNWDYLIRWAFRWIDIYSSFGSVAAMFISSSGKGQRLGDMIANTAVIRTRQSRSIALNEVLSIKTMNDYTPVYPEIMRCTEEDMLIIKNTLDRFRKYPNTAHWEQLNILANKVVQKIGLSDAPPEREQFLRTLLKDYVILSR